MLKRVCARVFACLRDCMCMKARRASILLMLRGCLSKRQYPFTFLLFCNGTHIDVINIMFYKYKVFIRDHCASRLESRDQ